MITMLQILVCAKVILEDKHVCDVALWIIEDGLEVGVHALLVEVVLGILFLLKATLVAAHLLLCLLVSPS